MISRLLVVLIFTVIHTQVFAGWGQAPSGDHSECEAMLAAALEEMDDTAFAVQSEAIVTESVEATLIADTGPVDIEKLIGLVLPKGYAENEADFQAARKRAIEEILPRVQKLREEADYLNGSFTFKDYLWMLAYRYDSATEEADKTAILTQIMSVFKISNELIYMDLIATSDHSKAFKKALYDSLAKLFKQDPSWRPYLDRAADRAGVSKS